MIPWGLGFCVDNLFIAVHVPTVLLMGEQGLNLAGRWYPWPMALSAR